MKSKIGGLIYFIATISSIFFLCAGFDPLIQDNKLVTLPYIAIAVTLHWTLAVIIYVIGRDIRKVLRES